MEGGREFTVDIAYGCTLRTEYSQLATGHLHVLKMSTTAFNDLIMPVECRSEHFMIVKHILDKIGNLKGKY